MSVKVKVHEPLRSMVGKGSISLDWRGGTLGDLIEELARQFGPEMKGQLLDAQGNLDYTYRIFINEVMADRLAHPVHDGDEVLVLIPIGGGR